MIFISMRTILMLFLPNTQLYMVLYAGDLMTLDRQGIKKHYFVEGERFLTNCGSEGHPWADPKKALEGIDESELTMCKEFTDNIITYFAKHKPACYKNFDQKADISSELFDIADMYSYLLKEHNDLGSYYLHTDRLGSGSAVTDDRGEARHILSYMPYGETLLDLSHTHYETPYQFTGYEKDQETGFHYAEARYYDSWLSTFNSTDPMWYKYPSLSPYAYCANNPINYIDPDGMDNYEISVKNKNVQINVSRTDDNTNSYKYIDSDGKIVDLGTYDKKGELIKVKQSTNFYEHSKYNDGYNYINGDVAAGLLAGMYSYYEETGNKVIITQLNNSDGGHSKHSGTGTNADIKYANKNGYKPHEPVWTNGKNYDKHNSQKLADSFYQFGFNSSRGSILTENATGNGRALNNTIFVDGKGRFHHKHHMHLQKFNASIINKK